MLTAAEDKADLPSTQVHIPKASELVALQLRRSIVRGELAAGDVLPPEHLLLERYGVSRPTLREAFRVLESEALIKVRRGSHGGARVQPPDGDVAARYAGLVLEYRKVSLADVFEAAATLEAPCVGKVARNRTAADLVILRAAVDREDSIIDAVAGLDAQNSFHRLVIELAGNKTLTMLCEMVRYITDLATARMLYREGATEKEVKARHKGTRTHRKLIDFIEARDVEAAEELWGRHVRETSRFLQTYGLESVVDLLD